MNTIKEDWEYIENWLKEYQPEEYAHLGNGASEEEITRLETRIKAKLPEDFRYSLTIHNGQREYSIILSDGRDNFELLCIGRIMEELDQMNIRWEEVAEEFKEAGEVLTERNIPIAEFSSNDKIYLNVDTGLIKNVDHGGFSYKLGNFTSLLNMNHRYLESGRFYLGKEYNMIDYMDIEKAWEKVLDIPDFKAGLNEPLERRADIAKEYQKMIEKEYDIEMSLRRNSILHFHGTYFKICNGQKDSSPLFTDGKNNYELLSFEKSMQEFKIIDSKKVTIPLFKGVDGSFIYMDPFIDIFNTSLLYKEHNGKLILLNYDLVDILLVTANYP